jgi:YjbE family integral membrane protein
MLEFLGAVGGIVLVDIVLSGDNALVIGAAAAGLTGRQRYYAILGGGAGAILLRITFAIAVTLLLQLPFLQALGGIALLIIAARLLLDRDAPASEHDKGRQEQDAQSQHAPAQRSFMSALLTILVADVTMSLDNVLAIGALAHGNLPVLAFGLLLSIGIVLTGSALVATLINRLPWLLDVAALVLGWTAGSMLVHDIRLGPALDALPNANILLPAAGVVIVLACDVWLRVRERQAQLVH